MDDSNKQQPEQPQQPHQSRHHKRKHSSKKKWVIIGVVAAIILIGGSTGGYVIISNQNSTKTPEVKTVEQIDADAQAQADGGNVSGAKAAYDDAIKNTSDTGQKVVLLIGEASVFYGEGDYNQALSIAKQAEEIDTTNENIVAFIAEIYRSNGDKQNALIYYQKAISLTGKIDPTEDRTLYYQNEIDILNGVNK